MATRRQFLAGLTAAGGLGALGFPRSASASLTASRLACETYKVLTIDVTRAVSHRDTLWVDQTDATDGWRVPPSMASVDAECVNTTFAFGACASGYDVHLGPWCWPLVNAGLSNPYRLAVVGHGLSEHGLAQALTLSGVQLGRAGFCSMGARVAARWGVEGDVPPSFVVDALGSPVATQWAVDTGALGPQYRPLVVPVGSDAFKTSLDRSVTLGGARRDAKDDLVDLYRRRYATLLAHDGDRLRSADFDTYDNALDAMIDYPLLRDLVQAGPTLAPGATERTGPAATAVRFGAHLLSAGARHVSVLAGGLFVDSHSSASYQAHATLHNGVLWGVARALADAYEDGTLNLADTLVVIRSEFGRAQQDASGTEHWPAAYPVLLFGGPIHQRGFSGSIDVDPEPDGVSVDGWSPTDVAAGIALAAGVEPFQNNAFSITDLSFAPASAEAAKATLTEGLFGIGNAPETCPITPGDLPEGS
ncbi:MAG: DUF1501 domain-containing protein [Myxococcota bacterium]